MRSKAFSLTRPLLPAFALVVLASALAVAEVPLVSYRSVYDLTLDPSADVPDIAAVTGRLVTELTGSACAGYTNKSRFVTQTTDTEGGRQTMDLRSTTYESADGEFVFESANYSDEELVDRSVGTAQRKDDSTSVSLTKPGRKAFDISSEVVFPTEQMTRIIQAAIDGERFLSFEVYDGSQAGESVFSTATIIGAASTAADDLGPETSIADAQFAAMRHWPVTISYFEKGGRTDPTPDYTLSLIVYENGIQRDIKLDYGKFALVGKLTRLEMLPDTPCPG